MSNRLDQERERLLQPERIAAGKAELEKLGVQIVYRCDTRIDFMFKGHKVQFFPYSGWHTGKSIKDGRGLKHLLDQLNPHTHNGGKGINIEFS